MNFKIDTKEKMHVITVESAFLSANMAEEIENTCCSYLDEPVKNVILKLEPVHTVEKGIAHLFTRMQSRFAEANASFVICCMSREVLNLLKEEDLLDLLNTTPTESEAWDIVQMEEIEREFLDLS